MGRSSLTKSLNSSMIAKFLFRDGNLGYGQTLDFERFSPTQCNCVIFPRFLSLSHLLL